MQAVVLTGRTLPGHDPETTWSAVAELFKLEPEAFKTRILNRSPITIREVSDEAEAQRLVAALTKCGAQPELSPSEGSKWFLQQAGRIGGPVPLQYLKHEYQAQRLAADVNVKSETDSGWTTLVNALGEPSVTFDIPPELDHHSRDDTPPPLPPNLGALNNSVSESRFQNTPPGLSDHIRASLKKYNKHIQLVCFECGYSGLMGVKATKVPWYFSWWVILSILIISVPFGGIGIFPSFVLALLRYSSIKNFTECPNCLATLKQL